MVSVMAKITPLKVAEEELEKKEIEEKKLVTRIIEIEGVQFKQVFTEDGELVSVTTL